MSLLFDALRHAQQSPDTGKTENNQKDINSAQAILASGNHFRILPYLVASLMLLTGTALWYYYQNSQTPPSAPLPAAQMSEAVSAVPAPLAASSVAETVANLPATASGAENLAYKDKSWTHPVESKKPAKYQRKTTSGLQEATRPDPLKPAYRALTEGNLDQAEQDYQSVLSQRPHEKDALLGLAVIAQRKQQNERATELYRQVLREDLGNATAAAGLVSLSGHADPVAAESQVRELIDLKPNAPEFHYALGGVLARQQRWGEAQQAFFRAYSLEPGKALYAYNLAVTLDRLHQSAALGYYEKAAQLDNDPMLNKATIQQRIQELQGSH